MDKGIQFLDHLGPGHDKIDIHLQGADYQNIGSMDASRLLGYFSQTMQNTGFPWRYYEAIPDKDGDGKLKKGKALSDFEVLAHLQAKQPKPVLFQPMRNLQLNLSSDSLTALAAAGSLGGGNVAGMTKLAALSKSTHVSAGSQGIEVKYGAPIVVANVPELKLLHQMYNPTDTIKAQTEVGKAAQELSYFTSKTSATPYPWRFYVKNKGNPIWRVAKSFFKKGIAGAAVGAGIGALVGGPLALFSHNLGLLTGFATAGAALGGGYAGVDGARTSFKGKPVNAVEALERVLDKKPVYFQESQLRSVGVPIMGSLSWVSDHGPASPISSPDELNTFYYMQDQDAKPPEPAKKQDAPPEAKKDKPEQAPQQIVYIDNRSYEPQGDLYLHDGSAANPPEAAGKTK